MLINSSAHEIPLADGSVQACITSPPYFGLRSYAGEQDRIWGGSPACEHEWVQAVKRGITGGTENDGVKGYEKYRVVPDSVSSTCCRCGAWYGALGSEPTTEQYAKNMVEVFREVRRVLRDDGQCWINLGDSYNGSGGAGGDYNAGGLREGQPKYSGRNIATMKPKDLVGNPFAVAFALRADGWYLRSVIPWIKRNAMPGSYKDRPVTGHEYWLQLTKSKKCYADMDAVRKPLSDGSIQSLTQKTFDSQTGGDKDYAKQGMRNDMSARNSLENLKKSHENGQGRSWRTTDPFFVSLDVMIAEQAAYLAHLEAIRDGTGMLLDEDGEPLAMVFNTSGYSGAHFATFSPKMIEPLVKFSTSERGCCEKCGAPWKRIIKKGMTKHDGETKTEYKKGMSANRLALLRQAAREHGEEYVNRIETIGWQPTCEHAGEPIPCTVLDPFVGSGSTLLAARDLGRNGVGLDISTEYLTMARGRLGLEALAEWENGRQAEEQNIEGLPLFEGIE